MLSRSSNAGLSGYFKATSNAVRVTQIATPVKTLSGDELQPVAPQHNYQLATSYPVGQLRSKFLATSTAVNGMKRSSCGNFISLINQLIISFSRTHTGKQQVRLAHSDLQIPSFDKYRKSSTKDVEKSSHETIDDRRAYAYLASATLGVGSAVFAKAAIRNIVGILSPSKDVLALSKVEVKLDDIPVGKNVIVKWRGKPLFIKHRTEADIKREEAVNVSELRDPQHDKERVQRPEWLVLLGVCTHLGCVPIAGQGEFQGYYCPCHGSHYDGSGRIRKGPAPLNLEVPEYEFKDNVLIVG